MKLLNLLLVIFLITNVPEEEKLFLDFCKKGKHKNILCANFIKYGEEKPCSKVSSITMNIGHEKFVIFNKNGVYEIVINNNQIIEEGLFKQKEIKKVTLGPYSNTKKSYDIEI